MAPLDLQAASRLSYLERRNRHFKMLEMSEANGSAHTPPRSRPRHRRNSSFSPNSLSSIDSDEKDSDYDGYRPSSHEIRQSISRSRSRQPQTLNGTTTGLSQPLSRTLSRRDTVLSRIRTRPDVASFRHPLGHQPATADVIVAFEGPDDPYRPINWPTSKKIVTTLFYGLTTMSATWASSAYSAGTEVACRGKNYGRKLVHVARKAVVPTREQCVAVRTGFPIFLS